MEKGDQVSESNMSHATRIGFAYGKSAQDIYEECQTDKIEVKEIELPGGLPK